MRKQWTGPRLGDLDEMDRLVVDLPPECWPFCVESEHDLGCTLRSYARDGVAKKGTFCDCNASDEGKMR